MVSASAAIPALRCISCVRQAERLLVRAHGLGLSPCQDLLAQDVGMPGMLRELTQHL